MAEKVRAKRFWTSVSGSADDKFNEWMAEKEAAKHFITITAFGFSNNNICILYTENDTEAYYD